MSRDKNVFVLYDTQGKEETGLSDSGNVKFFCARDKYAFCKGCFDCWLKTPGTCIMHDSVFGLADNLANCSTFIIVSKLLYGGFSTNIKGVVDRLIAFNLPYFKKLEGELHHIPRYNDPFKLIVFFYGEATEREKETAREYVSRIALNLNNEDNTVIFLKDGSEWRSEYENLTCGL